MFDAQMDPKGKVDFQMSCKTVMYENIFLCYLVMQTWPLRFKGTQP